jgi:hypothetical protein
MATQVRSLRVVQVRLMYVGNVPTVGVALESEEEMVEFLLGFLGGFIGSFVAITALQFLLGK